VHTYNENIAKEVEVKIRIKYFPLLKALHQDFRAKQGD
jgi:hypothetical protein